MYLPTFLLAIACTSSPWPGDDEAPSGTGSGAPADPSPTDPGGPEADPDADGDTATGDSGWSDTGEPPWCIPVRPDTDAPLVSDPWRHGGGRGYPDLVDPDWPVVTRVDTADALVAALASSSSGDIVFVDGGAEIDLTDRHPCVPDGVWLASDRGDGDAPGGLLYATNTERDGFIDVCGDDVRITGLRILGADPEQCPDAWPDACTGDIEGDTNCRDCTEASIGIQSVGFDRVEIDNNELAGWSYAATWFADGVDAHVHHNFIHHTWRQGLGYGVVLTGEPVVTATIAWNRFDANRHAIAGSGYPTQSYEARDNLVLENANGHVFDMHGQNEREHDGSEWAGDELLIHRNTVLVEDQWTLVVRGAPATGSWLYDNCLVVPESQAALQRFFTGRFHVGVDPSGTAAPNTYGAAPVNCVARRWCASEPGTGSWAWHHDSAAELGDVGVGDFDGDGTDDLFQADGTSWRVSYGAASGWTRLNGSTYLLSQIALVDVDGDGRTDVMSRNGGTWSVSLGGAASWTVWSSHTDALSSVLWGDLDGDGTDDAFRTAEGQWQWSAGGAADWQTLRADPTPFSELALADFDGDGRDDVFHANGSVWRMSAGGTDPWQTVGTSSYTLDRLVLQDANGNGITDVLRGSGASWWVSWDGRSRWARLRMGSVAMADVVWGDFDGDGRVEVLRSGCH